MIYEKQIIDDLQELVDEGSLEQSEFDYAVKKIDWKIDRWAIADFIVSFLLIKNGKKDFFKIKKVEDVLNTKDLNYFADQGYDEGYKVTFTNGKYKLYSADNEDLEEVE